MNAKKNLFQAIYDLLQIYNIEQVSTNMILEKADISRTTFYRYFKDKYDLMHWFYVSLHQQYVATYVDSSWEDICIRTATFTNNHRKFFQNAIKYTGQNSFMDFLRDYCRNFCIETCKRRLRSDVLTDEILFAIEYHCGGAVQIFLSWMNAEQGSDSDKLGKQFFACTPQLLREIMS